MELTEPPTKVRRINKVPSMHVTECVRQFKLPANFPGLSLSPSIDFAKPAHKIIHNISSDTVLDGTKNVNKSISSTNPNSLLKINKQLQPVTANSKNVNDASSLRTLKLKSPDGKDLGEFQVKLVDVTNQSAKKKFIAIPTSSIPANNECQDSEVSSPQTEPNVSYSMKDPGSMCQKSRMDKAKIVSNVSLNKLPAKDLSKIIEGKQMIDEIFSNTPFESSKINISKINNNSEANAKKLLFLKTDDHPYLKNITKSGKPITLKPLKLKSLSLNLKPNEQKKDGETVNFVSTGGLSGYKNGDMDEDCNVLTVMTSKKTQGTKSDDSVNDNEISTSSTKEKEADTDEDLNNDNEIPTSSTTNENAPDMDDYSNEVSPKSPKREWKKLPYTLTKNNVMVMLPKVPGKKAIPNRPSSDSGSDFGSLKLSDNETDDPTTEISHEQEDSDKQKNPTNNKLKRKNVNSRKNNSDKRKKENPEENDTNQELDISIVEKALASVKDKSLREEALKILASCKLGTERHVPIRSPNEISVRDTTCQTNIFGNLDPFCEEFVEVKKEEKEIKRINKTVRDRLMAFKSLNYMVTPMKEAEEENSFASELDRIIMDLDINSENKQEVLNIKNVLDRPIVSAEKISRMQTQIAEDIRLLTIHDESGLTGLHKAVMRDDSRTVKRLLMIQRLTRSNVDIRNGDDKTCLELALKIDADPEIVIDLLEAGAKPTSDEVGIDSALIIASKNSSPLLPQLTKYATKTSLDSLDIDGFAAIHNCALRGNLTAVKALIAAGADVNLQDRRSGRTALFHAIENGHIETARHLLSSGAKPSIRNNDGQTILPLLEEPKVQTLKNMVLKALKAH